MAQAAKTPTMNREQATELYKDLQKALLTLKARKAAQTRSGQPTAMDMAGSNDSQSTAPRFDNPVPANRGRFMRSDRGQQAAFALILFCAATHVAMSAFEYFGVFQAFPAEAAMARFNPQPIAAVGPTYSKDEVAVLKSLDKRRADLEERSREIDARERDLERRDRESSTRLTELRELAGALKVDREKNDRRQKEQLTQLANVYVSMSPSEAAHLMEQLDVQISLALIRNMPEKRIGQILALMSPERALMLTNMLSGQGK